RAPAARHGGVEGRSELAVAQAVEEGAQARALVVVLGDVRGGHAPLPAVAVSGSIICVVCAPRPAGPRPGDAAGVPLRPPRLTTHGSSANSSRHQTRA